MLKTSPLDRFHRMRDARMVAYAGWSMPVQYPTGIISEHRACRKGTALFDVSHMGQIAFEVTEAGTLLERLVPSDINGLKPGQSRYTVLLNELGGIEDDLIVTAWPHGLSLVVNASRTTHDLDWINGRLGLSLRADDTRVLLALQGPGAAEVIGRHMPAATGIKFMQATACALDGDEVYVTRSGYTGEDGFEISIAADRAEALVTDIMAEGDVTLAGLGARDTLRLEAGLCLYGQEIDDGTTPVEAGIGWIVAKNRLARRGFPGASIIKDQIQNGVERQLVGLLPAGRAPIRAGARIFDPEGAPVGHVTSGGFSPSLARPIAMGYINSDATGTVFIALRGREVETAIHRLPFRAHRYHR